MIFPFHIKHEPLGLSKNSYYPVVKAELSPAEGTTVEAGFVVNMPFLLPLDGAQKRVDELFSRIYKQAFDEREGNTSRDLRAVFGANRMRSLDKGLNRKFKEHIAKIKGVAVIGFLWVPKWVDEEGKAVSVRVVRKKWLEIKKEDPQRAKTLLHELENLGDNVRKCIPYGLIRERIKNCTFTVRAFRELTKAGLDRPLFLATQDPSLQKLFGLFSLYQKMVREHPEELHIASTGYRVGEEVPPAIRIAVALDQKVREALGNYFPTYPPEPNAIFRKLPGTKTLEESFLDGAKGGALEGRRLVVDMIARRGISHLHMRFQVEGAPIMEARERFHTETLVKLGEVTKSNRGLKTTVPTLRGLSQSHMHAHKWAEAVLKFLGETYQRALIKPIAAVLVRFDPYFLALNLRLGQYNKKRFEEVLQHYEEFVEYLSLAATIDDLIGKMEGEWQVLLETQLQLLCEAESELISSGVSKKMTGRVIEAAKAYGRTVATMLTQLPK